MINTNSIFVLFAMFFCHIADDFYMQGWLASAKQKSWWEKNAPGTMYRNDYIAALIMHCFSWTFMILFVPSLFGFCKTGMYLALFVINFSIHLFTDNAKANLKAINLIIDQSIHVAQIIITWLMIFC